MGNSERMIVPDRGRGVLIEEGKVFWHNLGKFDKLTEMGEHQLDGWRREETHNDADRGDEMEGLFTKEWIMLRKLIQNMIRTLSWFEKPDFTLCERKVLSIFECEKRVFWIVIRLESLIMRTCERKALSECDSCVCN